MKIPFLGGAYEGRSSNVSPETCMNLFYEKGKNGESLVGTAGSTLFSSPAVGEVRGGIAYNDLVYFVVGNTFYEINSSGTATSRGTLNSSSGRVSLAHNGVRTSGNQQIMIVDGTDGYVYDNSTSTLSQITDDDFVSGVTLAFVDGYFIFNENSGSGRFWLTNLYDGTNITDTDFSTAEGWPDKIQSIIADNRELFLFGEESLEVWYNSGDLDNTFQRYQGGFKQHGCMAPFSPARFDNGIIWLSRNDRGANQVVALSEGYQPSVVSTPEVNYQISTYANTQDAFGYSYQHEGHEFYVLTFPTPNKTWVFDASTREWHQRSHVISSIDSRERYNCHVYAMGRHLFGDYLNGNIYELDGSIGTFNSERVHRQRTTIPVTDEENRTRLMRMQLDMEEGIGSADTPVSTTLGGAEAVGQTTLTVTSSTGMLAGQRLEVDDDNGGTHSTTISSVTDGTTIVAADALTVASASGNAVRAYTDNKDDEFWLSYSKNGGHTFTNSIMMNAGEGGDWARRVIWYWLGQARNWIFKIDTWTPKRPVLKGLIAKMYGEK